MAADHSQCTRLDFVSIELLHDKHDVSMSYIDIALILMRGCFCNYLVKLG